VTVGRVADSGSSVIADPQVGGARVAKWRLISTFEPVVPARLNADGVA
jgi:hypothetical protein